MSAMLTFDANYNAPLLSAKRDQGSIPLLPMPPYKYIEIRNRRQSLLKPNRRNWWIYGKTNDLQQQQQQQAEWERSQGIFKQASKLRLRVDALQLSALGVESVDLLKRTISPIFTIEAQLSEELIKHVPHHPMFNVMLFETRDYRVKEQCAHFNMCGVAQERAIKWQFEDNAEELKLGRVYLPVWFREPGTCLNEMLGIGKLKLQDLYDEAVLEKCLEVPIMRRGKMLGKLALKISMLVDNNAVTTTTTNNNETAVPAAVEGVPINERSTAISGQAQRAAVADRSNNNANLLAVAPKPLETGKSQVEALHGLLYLNEITETKLPAADLLSLSFKPYWKAGEIVTVRCTNNKINYLEQFSIVNDVEFLKSVELKTLLITAQPHKAIVGLPLHRFYVAFKDSTLRAHLSKQPLPVFAADGSLPIVDGGLVLGTLDCLLAMGTAAQIEQLRNTRTFYAPTKLQKEFQKQQQQQQQSMFINYDFNIVGASGLPLYANPPVKSKKSGKRKAEVKVAPSTYATFCAVPGKGITLSQEQQQQDKQSSSATKIVEGTTEPKWQHKIQLSIEAQRLKERGTVAKIKIWRRTPTTKREDLLIGSVDIDFDVFPEHQQQRFNGVLFAIRDSAKKIVGKLEAYAVCAEHNTETSSSSSSSSPPPTTATTLVENFNPAKALQELGLQSAVELQMKELQQISDRLRHELSIVTGTPLAERFDDTQLNDWQMLTAADIADTDSDAEFENYLKTPPPTSPNPVEREEPTAHSAQISIETAKFNAGAALDAKHLYK